MELFGIVDIISKKLHLYYVLWVVIHYVYLFTTKLHSFCVEYLWNRIIVKYCISILCNYYYNSSIYYNFCHYYNKSSKGSSQDQQNSKTLANLQDYIERQDVFSLVQVVNTLAKYPKHLAFGIANLQETPSGAGRSHSKKADLSGNNNGEQGDEDQEDDCQLILKQNHNQTRIGQNEIKSLCRLMCWAWMAQVEVISLYDYNGLLKGAPAQLKLNLQHELETTILILQKCQPRLVRKQCQRLPVIRFHTGGRSNSMETESTSNVLHICIFSRMDGKRTIVQTVSQLTSSRSPATYKANKHSNNRNGFVDNLSINNDPHCHHRQSEIKESKINSILSQFLYPSFTGDCVPISSNSCSITEPDLLLILGSLKSTLGFLPWHLRLTEIHWIPELLKVDAQDIIEVLQKYSKSQQRFGS